MLVSKNWIKSFVDIDANTNDICEKLTALGLEVEGVNPAAPAFSKVVVGKVIELEQHPDADKLRVATVDVGADEPLQIVCGAPNVAIGMLSPTALIGAVLPGDFKIKKSKLRGVESNGMLCSASELGLAEEKDGLLELPASLTVGANIRQVLDLNDEVIEVGLTPNRGDCMSILGVARELAVAYEKELNGESLKTDFSEIDDVSPAVTLSAPEGCVTYIARKISGIDNTLKSPLWLKERLRRAGLRSLSPVVDVTNYVMLTLGAPLHAFDANKINGGINVRFAKQDEKLTLLDGKEIKLSDDVLVIADEQAAIAMAGIMGGKDSEVSNNSTEIVLEAAWFNADTVVGRGRRYNLFTDAAQRFERGVDYRVQQQAIDLATQLIIKICGGKAHKATIAIDEKSLPTRQSISLNARKVDAVLGFRFPRKRIAGIFESLGMQVEEKDKGEFLVTPPSYRFDIEIAEDLIEELARVNGYDKVPVTNVSYLKLDNREEKAEDISSLIHDTLTHLGYQEAISYSFLDKKSAELLTDSIAVPLQNPISEELSVMRTSLLPSLLKALQYNVNRQQKQVRLYEIGKTYSYTNEAKEGFVEKKYVAGILYGHGQPLQWGYRERLLDFFDAKGHVETLLENLGFNGVRFARIESELLHPGQSVGLFVGDKEIGRVGTLHPKLAANFDIDEKAFYFELCLDTVPGLDVVVATAISKYPVIRRDISLLMAQGHQFADILSSIKKVANNLVAEVTLFDVYVGRNIARGMKSMAFSIYLQDKTRTLTDEQADQVIADITDVLVKEYNAKLRG